MNKALVFILVFFGLFLLGAKSAHAACWITTSSGIYNMDAFNWGFYINEDTPSLPYTWSCDDGNGAGCGSSYFGSQSGNYINWYGDSDPNIPIHTISVVNGIGETCEKDVHVFERAVGFSEVSPTNPHCGYLGSNVVTNVKGPENGSPPEIEGKVRMFSTFPYPGFGTIPLADISIDDWDYNIASESYDITWTHPGDIDSSGGPWYYTYVSDDYCEDAESSYCSNPPDQSEWPSPVGRPTGARLLYVYYCPPELSVTPTALSFTAPQGGPNPSSKNIRIDNVGGGTLNWTVTDNQTWISASPASGSAPPQPDYVAVSIDTTGLGVGSYSGTVTVASTEAINSPKTVTVNLTITVPPEISLSPTVLNFEIGYGQGNPASKSFLIDNSGGSTLNWTATESTSWMWISNVSGTVPIGPDTNWVGIYVSGLSPGTYRSDVTVSDPYASNNPRQVEINLTITPTAEIAGYVWDDASDGTNPPNKLKGVNEVNLTDGSIQIALQKPAGTTIATRTPNGLGQYSFTGLVPGSGYRVLITPTTGWCDGTGGYGATGWNDGTTGNSYVTTASPYDTGDITALASVVTTVNLGLTSDYLMSVQPISGQLQLEPGAQGNFTVTADPYPTATACWNGGDVALSTNNVPLEITINSIVPNPINPNGTNDATVTLTVASGASPGSYNFDMVADNSNFSTRSRVLGLTVIVNTDPWIQAMGGEVYSAYNDLITEPSIQVVIPDNPAPFANLFLINTASPKSHGIPFASQGIDVTNSTGDAINMRNWGVEDYSDKISYKIDTGILNGLGINNSILNLIAGESYKNENTSLSGEYNITGDGVSLLYFNNNVTIDGDLYARNAGTGLIVISSGDINISQDIGTNPPAPTNNPNIEAVLISFGDINVQGAGSGNKFLKIKGMMISLNAVNILRNLDDNTFPVVLVEYDPLYLFHGFDALVSDNVEWKEIIAP